MFEVHRDELAGCDRVWGVVDDDPSATADDGVDVVVAVVCVVMGDRFRVCGKLDLVDLERGDTEGLADASVVGAGRWVRTVSSGHRFCIHYHVPHAGQS